MDLDQLRSDVLRELDAHAVDFATGRQRVRALAHRRRRQRRAVTAALLVVAGIGAALSLEHQSGPSEVGVVSDGGGPEASDDLTPMFLLPDPLPAGMTVLSAIPPGDAQGSGATGEGRTQRWARLTGDGSPAAVLDVQWIDGDLQSFPGAPTMVGDFEATLDGEAGVLAFEPASGEVVVVTSAGLPPAQLLGVGESWQPGPEFEFEVTAPEDFELIADFPSRLETGPDVRSVYVGEAAGRGFGLVLDEPADDDVGAEVAFADTQVLTVRGQRAFLATQSFGILGASFEPTTAFLSPADLYLRWREGTTVISLFSDGLSREELLALAESLQPVPASDWGLPAGETDPSETTSGPETSQPSTEAESPPPFAVAIQVDSRSVQPGGPVTGTITVTNNSGNPLPITYCASEFAAVLSNDDIPQTPLMMLCAQQGSIPVGTSTYTLQTTATYTSCGAPPSEPCDASGQPPALPPGTYRLVVHTPSEQLVPPTLEIEVASR